MNKKNSQRKEKRMNLMIYIWMIVRVPVILGILVGFFYMPLITQPKISDICLVRIFSLLLFALGVLIIVHSSTILIKNAKFSPPTELKLDPIPQNLVTTGLYKYIRHPIYIGVILVYLCYCLLLRAILCILILNPLLVLCLYFKARQEEKDLKNEFDEVYKKYIKKTGMFLPRIKKKEVKS